MDKLSAAANVLAPAFCILEEKGYQVYYVKEQDWWVAENSYVRLIRYSTIELCGLAYIYETKGNNWSVSDDAIEAFLKLE